MEMWLSQEISRQIVRRRKDFFKRIVEKVDGGVFQTVLSERHIESVRLVRIERHVPRVGPACNFTQIYRE